MRTRLDYVFRQIDIGSITLRNRVVFGAHTTNFAENHQPSARHALYYGERAKGGVGLIITEEQIAHPSDYPYERAIFGFDQGGIPANRMLADAVHLHGAKIFAQINHHGQQADGSLSRRPVWAPSPVPDVVSGEMPKAMEKEEIREVIMGFAKAAGHAKRGGMDGVELRASQSSLIRQFLSPLTNQRSDEYGGDLQNRLRFCQEVVEAVRAEVGAEFPLGIRLCCDELAPWAGLTPDDARLIAGELEATGRIDYIGVSIGSIYSLHMPWPSMHVPPGFAIHLAAAIKEVVKVPVIATGRIHDILQAEQIIAAGQADLVEMTRALIADPQLLNKAREGLIEDIRPCAACNQGCLVMGRLNQPLRCTINPVVGHEMELAEEDPRRAPERRVIVVGGGPAGLEAARVAAQRGHKVILYEREDRLGGQVGVAADGPGRGELRRIIDYFAHQLGRLGVEVKLNTHVEKGILLEQIPDVVVVATGSRPSRPSFLGSDQGGIVYAQEILEGKVEVGQRVLLFDQVGSYEATSVAELLARSGKEVTIVTEDPFVGWELAAMQDLALWYERVIPLGVTFLPYTRLKKVMDSTVVLVNRYTQEAQPLEGIDTVVVVTPRLPNEELYLSLKGKLKGLYRVGDCVAPRNIRAAILEGHRVGKRI